MKRFDRSIQGLLATGNRLLSNPFKLKLLMIAQEKLVCTATHTPIHLSHQTRHGALLIMANNNTVQIGWQLPAPQSPKEPCEHDTSNANANANANSTPAPNADHSDHNDCNMPMAIFARFVEEMMRSTTPATQPCTHPDHAKPQGTQAPYPAIKNTVRLDRPN